MAVRTFADPLSLLRTLGVVAVVSALAFLAACGGDPEPDPAATATQPPATATPAATPEPSPTATPEPPATPAQATATPTAAAEQPAASLEGFVIDATATGQDLIDRLSSDEVACIEAAVGDAIYGILLGTPLALSIANVADAAPLFACLTEDNVVLLGAAVIDAQAGGRTEETRQCILDLAREHPELVYVRLGLEWPGGTASHPEEVHLFFKDYYVCMTPAEQVDFAIRLWAGLSVANPVSGRDLVETLNEEEAACFRTFVGDERWDLFLGSQIAGAGRANRSALLEACFPGNATARLFVHVSSARLGGLSESTHECLEGFVIGRPDFVGLIVGGAAEAEALDAEDFVAIARDAADFFRCLNPEELRVLQGIYPAALSGP